MDPRAWLDRLGRRPEPPADLVAAVADLDRLATARPELAAAAKGLAGLMEAAFLIRDPAPPDPPDREAVARGWSGGIPVCRSGPPRLDGPTLIARALAVANAVGPGDPAAKALREAIRRRRLDPMALTSEVFAGRPEEVDRRAEAAGVAPGLAASVLRLALLPSLAMWSALLDRGRPEGAWGRGDCPDCGSRPLLAESRGLEQRIAYRCGLCAGDWSGERLRCPACGETDPKALRYSFVEGEQERFRLAHCEACSSHWKVVATLAPLSAPGLLVADLATFHLDVLAEGGFPPALR